VYFICGVVVSQVEEYTFECDPIICLALQAITIKDIIRTWFGSVWNQKRNTEQHVIHL